VYFGTSELDCAGVCDGTGSLDYCGVCNGGNVANECEEEEPEEPEVDPCIAAGGLIVSMVDAYGDGWNGNVLTIGDESFTIEDGASAEGCYMGGSDVAVTCGGGSWGSEVSWTVSDGDGVVLSGGAPFDGCLGTCPESGCTENAITLVVGGGSWDVEISWDLSDGASGAAGTFDKSQDISTSQEPPPTTKV
jgi:hypothetical protein